MSNRKHTYTNQCQTASIHILVHSSNPDSDVALHYQDLVQGKVQTTSPRNHFIGQVHNIFRPRKVYCKVAPDSFNPTSPLKSWLWLTHFVIPTIMCKSSIIDIPRVSKSSIIPHLIMFQRATFEKLVQSYPTNAGHHQHL